VTTTARPARTRHWLPPQHGAWALLLVPYLAGLLAAGTTWWDLPVLVAALAGYPLSYFALLAVKTRRLDRVGAQVAVFGAVTLAALVPLLAARPALSVYALPYGLLLAGNAWYARRRRERALVNDLFFVVESALLVPVAGTVAGVAPGVLGDAFVAVVLYGVGTVLFVKTMIRERRNPAYRRASVVYHVAALAVAAVLAPALAVPFAALLARAVLLPGRALRPAAVGMVELAGAVLVLAGVAVAYA
jgi:hypothetical protein